jgi:hypothetical protein
MSIVVTIYNMKDQPTRRFHTEDWVDAMQYVEKHHERSCMVGISVNASPEVVLIVSENISVYEVKT